MSETQAITAAAPDTDAALMTSLLAMSPRRLAAVLADEPKRAAPWVLAAARCGMAEAQVRYGRLLLEGDGVTRDPAGALAWFGRAAQAGDADAQNMVGRCLENGWGAPVDLIEAAHWYRRAAEAGEPWAQYNLGHLYLNGAGVARDASAAYGWYRRAADQGHGRAMNLVGRCFEHGWGVDADPAAARDWYRRSAEGGYFRGQYNFASLLLGEGQLVKAVALFEAAVADAPPSSRQVMAQALAESRNPRLAALGRRALETAA